MVWLTPPHRGTVLWLAVFACTVFTVLPFPSVRPALGQADGPTPGAVGQDAVGSTAPEQSTLGRSLSNIDPTLDALENAVEGSYRLGPGDRIGLNLWGDPPVAFDLRVTLQGTLIVPQVGEIPVSGLTIDDAREAIADAVAVRYRRQPFTLTLLQLRRFQVHVTGQVQRPGAVLTTAVDRVLDAIARAGGPLETAGLRNVEIRRPGDEGSYRADLARFLETGDISHNPTVKDGEVIFVPFRGALVHVYGAVNAPGPYEYLSGDTVGGLLALAGGLTADANPDSIEVTRFVSGTQTTRFSVALQDVTPAGEAIFLKEGDQIFVRRRLNWYRRELVDVRGEVKFPGSFSIVDGTTRLSEVIERAGGFTDQAFLQEASVVRRRSIKLDDKEVERLRLLTPSEMTDDEYEYFKMKSREEKGLMVVDFVELFVGGDKSQDILLRAGDLIDVPPRKDFVSVLGEVAAPGNIVFDSQLTIDDYIRMAGGYAGNADRGKVRVIRVATGEWVKRSDARTLYAGDTVWVPEKPDRDYWNIFKETLGVVTQVLTVYLIVDRATQ